MKRIEIIASESTFGNLATFETIDQLNETVRHYKDMIAGMNLRQDVKRNLLTVLEYIKRHSCRFFGVSWKGKRKIAADIGMSDKTVTRLCKRLESLGIVRQCAMKRASDMQQTSNAIVILPPVVSEQPVKYDDVVTFANSATSHNIKTENVRQESAKVSDQENNTFLKQKPYLHNTYPSGPVAPTPYVKFKSFVSNFVNDPKLTSKLYGIYLAQTSYIRDYYADGELLDTGLQALKTTFQATKRKRLRNIAGYYHGTLDRLLDRLYTELVR